MRAQANVPIQTIVLHGCASEDEMDKILVTTCDADSKFPPQYIAALTQRYLKENQSPLLYNWKLDSLYSLDESDRRTITNTSIIGTSASGPTSGETVEIEMMESPTAAACMCYLLRYSTVFKWFIWSDVKDASLAVGYIMYGMLAFSVAFTIDDVSSEISSIF